MWPERCPVAGRPLLGPANRTINHLRVRVEEQERLARPTMASPGDGVIRQPSWGRLGLEVATDLVGWLAVFAILQAIGVSAIQKITGPSLGWELLLVLLLFFAVTVVVRAIFILLARRAPH